MQKPFFTAGILCMMLVACVSREQLPPPSEIFGPYTATGTVTATGSSLYRRGTHVLQVNARSRFYLESRTVDLRAHEGSEVVVQGELSANTHSSFLPVLQVQSVQRVEREDPQPSERYTIEALGLSLEAPAAWQSELREGRLTFRVPSEATPFIEVVRSALTVLPEGLPVRIAARNGTRLVDEAGRRHEVYVEKEEKEIILFSFQPQGTDSALLRDAFYTLLQSVKFAEAVEEEGTEPDGSGQPCGGPAGVLCPEGEYCEVQELETGIGTCRVLNGSEGGEGNEGL